MRLHEKWKRLPRDVRRWLSLIAWLVAANLVLLAGLVLHRLGVLLYGWDWTGFGNALDVPTADPLTVLVQARPARKTLWDWMELLIVPTVIAGGGYLFSQAQQRSELARAERRERVDREIATDRMQEATLEDYLDRMTELVLQGRLHGADPQDPEEKIQELARVRTLTVLLRLNGRRKGLILRFLQELHLIQRDGPIVELRGADFSRAALGAANLPQADFSHTHLADLLLQDADLRGASLNQAVLDRSILTNADLSGAWMQECSLVRANLERANLTGIDLRDANLREANFQQANLSSANLRGARAAEVRWEGARYNRHTIWPDGAPPAGAVLLPSE